MNTNQTASAVGVLVLTISSNYSKKRDPPESNPQNQPLLDSSPRRIPGSIRMTGGRTVIGQAGRNPERSRAGIFPGAGRWDLKMVFYFTFILESIEGRSKW